MVVSIDIRKRPPSLLVHLKKVGIKMLLKSDSYTAGWQEVWDRKIEGPRMLTKFQGNAAITQSQELSGETTAYS